MTDQVLVAGIGNIFLGDDAFGCEVVSALRNHAFPYKVRVVDFGIRGLDLAYALLDPWEAVILIDALPRGEAAGTLYLVEPNLSSIPSAVSSLPAIDAHGMDPVKVLQLAAAMGEVPSKIYILGCEPQDCGGEEGRMGLSAAVEGAIPEAIRMIDALVSRIFDKQTAGATKLFDEVRR